MSPPGEFDVICGRGRSTFLHSGNKRFRALIEHHIALYSEANTRLEKSLVVSRICGAVREKGDFLQQSSDEQWIKVSERLAREKCGQGLRDTLHSKYRSSAQAKQVRRKTDLVEQSEMMAQMIQQNVQIRSVLDQVKGNLAAADSESLSDDAVLSLFTQANSCILGALKSCGLSLPSSKPSSHSTVISSPRSVMARQIRPVEEHDEEQFMSLLCLNNTDFW
jgi:hypothetical protein